MGELIELRLQNRPTSVLDTYNTSYKGKKRKSLIFFFCQGQVTLQEMVAGYAQKGFHLGLNSVKWRGNLSPAALLCSLHQQLPFYPIVFVFVSTLKI